MSMMWDGFDKRKFPRIKLHCEIIIESEENAAPIIATTENIGVGGVCVILEQPLERFMPCRISIALDSQDVKLEGKGKVAWIVTTRAVKSTKNKFDTGIEFTELDEAQHQVLCQYLEANV